MPTPLANLETPPVHRGGRSQQGGVREGGPCAPTPEGTVSEELGPHRQDP